MTERVKVNVAFSLELPVKRDPLTDRLLQPAELVAPYIDEYFYQLDLMVQAAEGRVLTADGFPYAEYESICKTHVEINEEQRKRLDDNLQRTNERVAESEMNRTKWFDSQDEECKELYGMSSREWYRMSWKDRDAVKQEKGIVWDGALAKWTVDKNLVKKD